MRFQVEIYVTKNYHVYRTASVVAIDFLFPLELPDGSMQTCRQCICQMDILVLIVQYSSVKALTSSDHERVIQSVSDSHFVLQ